MSRVAHYAHSRWYPERGEEAKRHILCYLCYLLLLTTTITTPWEHAESVPGKEAVKALEIHPGEIGGLVLAGQQALTKGSILASVWR